MIRDQLDQFKAEYAGHFQTTVDYFRTHPLTDDCFTEMWVTGLKNRLEVRDKVPPVAGEVISVLAECFPTRALESVAQTSLVHRSIGHPQRMGRHCDLPFLPKGPALDRLQRRRVLFREQC